MLHLRLLMQLRLLMFMIVYLKYTVDCLVCVFLSIRTLWRTERIPTHFLLISTAAAPWIWIEKNRGARSLVTLRPAHSPPPSKIWAEDKNNSNNKAPSSDAFELSTWIQCYEEKEEYPFKKEFLEVDSMPGIQTKWIEHIIVIIHWCGIVDRSTGTHGPFPLIINSKWLKRIQAAKHHDRRITYCDRLLWHISEFGLVPPVLVWYPMIIRYVKHTSHQAHHPVNSQAIE
jgi:hypothetical protein